MSQESTGQVHRTTVGGIAGSHPTRQPLALLAAPSTSKEHNTIRPGIFPKACWRVEDVRFEFDSSLVKPDVAKEIPHLAELVEKHTETNAQTGESRKPPLSIFGHADPVGNDDYNKLLSGRRAQAIYGLLTRDADLWEDLFSNPLGGDNWGDKAIETMQAALGQPVGPASGAAARKSLFLAYMEKICTAPDGKSFQLEKTDFLARGADPKGKADYQGCGEFNPILLFSQQEEQQFAPPNMHEKRNAAYGPNRRVVAFLFRPGSQVSPDRWPCPRAKEGVAGCKKRFWSDGEKRRGQRLPDERREFENTNDTFACRFYDRLSNDSPCERILKVFKVRLFDRLAQPIPGAPFVALVDGSQSPLEHADSKGDATLHNIRVPTTCTIRWSRPKEQRGGGAARPNIDEFEASLRADGATDEEIQRLRSGQPSDDELFEFEREIFIDIPPDAEKEQIVESSAVDKGDQNRLHNMGYSSEERAEDNLKAFERDCVATNGSPVADVTAELRKRHSDCDPPKRIKQK